MTTPQTPKQLEPCPFCGTPARLSLDGDHHGEFFELGCPDEKCPAHWTYYTEEISNLDSAIIAWNSRHYKSTEFRLLELVDSNRSDLAEMRGLLESAIMDFRKLKPFIGDAAEATANLYETDLKRLCSHT